MRHNSWQLFPTPRKPVPLSFHCRLATLPNTRNWGTGVWGMYFDETSRDEQIPISRFPTNRYILQKSGSRRTGARTFCSSTNTPPVRPVSCKWLRRGDSVNSSWRDVHSNPRIKARRPRDHPRLRKRSIHFREMGR